MKVLFFICHKSNVYDKIKQDRTLIAHSYINVPIIVFTGFYMVVKNV